MRTTIAFLLSLVALSSATPEYIGNVGECPTNTPDCDLDMLSGVWYYVRGNANPYEPKYNCPEVEIFRDGQNAINTQKTSIQENGQYFTALETCQKIGKTGFLNTTYSSINADQNIMVTSLTATHITLVYCSKNNKYLGTQAEILTRTSLPRQEILDEAEQTLKSYNIDMTEFIDYNQKDCFTKPVLESYSNSHLVNLVQSSD